MIGGFAPGDKPGFVVVNMQAVDRRFPTLGLRLVVQDSWRPA